MTQANRPRPGGERPRPHFHSSALPSPPAVEQRISSGLLAVGYLVFAVAGVLTAAFEVLLVPTRWGTTLVPVAPVLAIISNVLLVNICFRLTNTRLSALPPYIGWALATFWLAMSRPEGDVLLPAGDVAWVSYTLLLTGLLAGAIAVGTARSPGLLDAGWLSRRRARGGSGSGDAR